MQALVVKHSGQGAADHRGRDVVQETRKHEHTEQQDEAALPVVRQEAR